MRATDATTPLRVLVVDDCRDHTDSLAILVQLWGHDARAAYDGPTALEAAAAYLPEVVLLDVGLPGMDGYEVARHLRRHDGLAGATLIAVSGYVQETDRQHSRDAGCAEHLAKPVDLDLLQELLAARKAALRTPAPAPAGCNGPRERGTVP
jgi:two-component system CheB/CheR fusion protein